MSKPWPSSPLTVAQRAFDLLTCPPAPLAFDGRKFPGLPKRILPLDELKRALIADTTSRPVRDRVWRELVIRARRDGPAWVVAAVGIAMPGLRRIAGLLAAGWHGDTTDWDAELLAGFLARLRTIDLDAPRICGRLIDAGARTVKHAREREEETDIVRVEAAWSLPPHHPWDHPDWVLARAVAAAVIDPDEHLLISATRLEDVTLQVVADKIGISVTLAAAWRRKAERRLAGAIAAGELDWAPLALPDTARRRASRAARTGAAIPARTARDSVDVPPAPQRSGRAVRQVPAAERRRTPAVAGTAG